MKLIKNLWIKFVVWRYIRIGLCWGEFESYLDSKMYNGGNYFYNKLIRWEKKYSKLGFIPVPKNVWVMAGGYNAKFDDFLYIKNV